MGFHVGPQCKNIENWPIGIRAALATFEKMRAVVLEPRFLNLREGFPVSMWRTPAGSYGRSSAPRHAMASVGSTSTPASIAYSDLAELADEFRFSICTDRYGPAIPWTVAGPTCDGTDVCLTSPPSHQLRRCNTVR